MSVNDLQKAGHIPRNVYTFRMQQQPRGQLLHNKLGVQGWAGTEGRDHVACRLMLEWGDTAKSSKPTAGSQHRTQKSENPDCFYCTWQKSS